MNEELQAEILKFLEDVAEISPTDYGPYLRWVPREAEELLANIKGRTAVSNDVAKELLKACEEALALIEDTYVWKEGPGILLIDKLKRLIAKAKGEQP